MTIDQKSKIKEIVSLIDGPYFALCNSYDTAVAEWIAKNCHSYDSNARRILERVSRLCPRENRLSPTISKILGLIILKPRRFVGKDNDAYRAMLSYRYKAPRAWKTFLKNSEKVNQYEDWMQLFRDFGYDGPMDYWEPEYYNYVTKKLQETAKH
ncbi:MAG: hypothetical protein WC386_01020 [Candidatus Paceibacterota bacterium]|jgi:hypothetical protein